MKDYAKTQKDQINNVTREKYKPNINKEIILETPTYCKENLQILIILPTHELVNQVYSVIKEIGNYLDLFIAKVIGGTRINESARELNKNPKIIVGTPGRVLDMINRKYLITEHLKMLIFIKIIIKLPVKNQNMRSFLVLVIDC